ncbi:hypothetical protein ACIP98_21195 [Streptomyces sp. NPDC088354]|uniref:competence protein CoiA family protein n=1 Tax=Streptomyces sp. NPDC088354 TaxID=3365856 RepID=UPI003819093E
MANGVWHSGLQRILELDKEDLGLGGAVTSVLSLIEELLRPVAERDRELLVCVESSQHRQCKAERSGVKSPFMYVRKHRGPDGALRLRAVHLPTVHKMTPEESDRHKAMKDFMARTAQQAGLEVHVEVTTTTRTSRPDVTIVGAGGVSLGCEAQYYNASAGTVLRRSKAHADAGLAANWITHDDRFHLIDRSNWMLTRPMTWREISSAADLTLYGGYRALAEWRCTMTAERPCLNANGYTACGKVHLQWETPRGLDDEGTGWTRAQGNTQGATVGRTLIAAATGSVAQLFVPSRKDRRAGAFMWVPATDRTRWTEFQGEESPDLDESQAGEEAIRFSGDDADDTCRFGENTWAPSAPLQRRGTHLAGLAITIDDFPSPQPAVAVPAPRHASDVTGIASIGEQEETLPSPVPLPAVPRAGIELPNAAPGAGTAMPAATEPDPSARTCPSQSIGSCAKCQRATHRYGTGGCPLCQWCMASAMEKWSPTVRYVSARMTRRLAS